MNHKHTKPFNNAPHISCILCHSDDTSVIDMVDVHDLCALYKRNLGIDIYLSSDIYYHHCHNCDMKFFTYIDGTRPVGDESFYNALNKLEWYYFSDKHEYHYAQSYIKPTDRVLEVGCGKGAFAHFLPQEAREHYIGLEFSTQAKHMAKENGITIKNIAIEEYALHHANSFDIACSFQVLEHVSNPHAFLQAQINCLKSTSITTTTHSLHNVRATATGGGGGGELHADKI